MNALLDYYAGEASDDRGRRLADVQRWPDERLEAVHDFIQWMFPLRERSGANPSAPVLDQTSIDEFRSRPQIQEMLRASFVRMLKFYGLELQYVPHVRVATASNYEARSKNWLTHSNHNHLRITRIIRSLRTLGLEKEAGAFFDCLAGIYHTQGDAKPAISDETFRFWKSAAQEASRP